MRGTTPNRPDRAVLLLLGGGMQDIVAFVSERASDGVYDTTMGRAFFRAAGVNVPEPVVVGRIVRHDSHVDAESLMRQRYGVEL